MIEAAQVRLSPTRPEIGFEATGECPENEQWESCRLRGDASSVVAVDIRRIRLHT